MGVAILIPDMAGGSCKSLDELPEKAAEILGRSRRAVLSTVDASLGAGVLGNG